MRADEPGTIALPRRLGSRPAFAPRSLPRVARLLRPRPELAALLVLAATLDLWALSRNGWANEYYSAAVRSMSSSWHNFLFASLDPSGVMTVDKPPLALWVQALSARVFGYHPLSLLVPQALMGVAAVALVYDLTRRRFGRGAGFVAGLALAVTPMTVAVSRHNNPDALLVLCCVAALWFAVRALEDGRTRWLVLAGACVGLGFETKMGVALMVVPGIAAAWLWVAPRGRRAALRQLLADGATMVLVGGAWPALVALTPAANRPWISGTSDNSILSLILDYNGLGRLDGQSGGPQALGGAGPFGGSAGPLRLLNQSLGGQGGWLLGFAIVAGVAMAVASRLHRADARTGWLLAVGGSFATTAVAFSAARGIFHPYYVSLLAPFTAALVGGGAAQLVSARGRSRLLAPLAVVAGAGVELAVLHDYSGQLTWLAPLLGALAALTAVVLATAPAGRVRTLALATALAALLIAPAAWSLDTLGYAASETFPAGGPQSASAQGPGGPGGPGRVAGRPGFGPGAQSGSGRPPGVPGAGLPGAGLAGAAPPLFGPAGPAGAGGLPSRAAGGAGPFGGGDASLTRVARYVAAHGGGTIAVASQTSAARSIIASDAKVAGIGGFSGRESAVSVSWFAARVRSGQIRWVLADSLGGPGGGPGGNSGASGGPGARGALAGGPGGPVGDARAGSSRVLAAVQRACTSVPASAYDGASSSAQSSSGGGIAGGGTSTGGLYDCAGRASALLSAA